MSGSEGDKAAWVRRVLGVSIPAVATGGAADAGTIVAAPGWSSARQSWNAASETVDGQIAGLQSILRGSGDDTLEEIAEFGLNAITGNHRVRLMAALMELGAGDPSAMQKSGSKALGIIDEFTAFLDADEAIAVCDANPFGAPVTIRSTLGAALRQMAASLQASTQAAAA